MVPGGPELGGANAVNQGDGTIAEGNQNLWGEAFVNEVLGPNQLGPRTVIHLWAHPKITSIK